MELRASDGLLKARGRFEDYYESQQVTWEEIGVQYLKLFEEKLEA